MRLRRIHLALFALVAGATSVGLYAAAQPQERVIRVVSKKFTFTPNELRLKKGEPVIIELVASDVFMGFSIPDLKFRGDMIPGKITRMRFVPEKAGKFTVICDVFCGDGHEDMHGLISVVE